MARTQDGPQTLHGASQLPRGQIPGKYIWRRGERYDNPVKASYVELNVCID